MADAARPHEAAVAPPSPASHEAAAAAAPPPASRQAMTLPPVPGIAPPPPLNIDHNVSEEWKLFKQKWRNYAIIKSLNAHPREFCVALFLHTIGDEALKIYNGFTFVDEDNVTVDQIIAKFDTFALGETNETYERFVFNKRHQDENESFESFLSAIRSLSKTCNYCADCSDSIIRDRIVLGIADRNTQTSLLKERKLTLQQCVDICKSAEKAAQQSVTLRADAIHKVTSNKQRLHPSSEVKDCLYCGESHIMRKEKCPAYGKTCSSCGKSNHFAQKCKSLARKKPSHLYKHKVHQLEQDTSSEAEDWVNMVSHSKASSIKCRLQIGPERNFVTFQVDTGATVNILPERYATSITPTLKTLKMWNHTDVIPMGTCRTTVRNPVNHKKYSVEFVVVGNTCNFVPLIGCSAAEAMNLVSVNDNNFERVSAITMMDKYSDVFSKGLGTFPGMHHLKVNPDVVPVIMPNRRIPHAVRPALKTELDRLCDLKVLAPVDTPTPWLSQLVIAKKKNGDIRVCIDPRELNRALLRERYSLPILDEVLYEMRDSRIFSKADLSSGYWHVQLDEESSLLTTFQTSFGNYRWLRLPFGTCVSAEIFQKKILEALNGLPGIVCIADDVLIHGRTKEEHDAHLEQFLQRCLEQGIKLNADKLELHLSEISFMGHHISANGLHSDPEKVRAIVHMTSPSNIEELRRFLGMVNYLGKFLPNAATVLKPLQNLLKKDVTWNWSSTQQESFENIKLLLTSAPVLSFYDPQKSLTVENDASEYGIGSAMYQDGKPIAFASRSLNQAERNYAQIEKEMLAVLFGLEKFHYYTFGRHVNVITDHKPLEAIVKKPLSKAPKRLQSLLLKSQKYDYTVTYKPGKSIPVADALSRAPLNDQQRVTTDEYDNIALLDIKDHRLQDIRKATENDKNLTQLITTIMTGWPQHKASLPSALTPYYSYRDELTVQDGIVFKGDCVVIPSSMRREMKERLHCGHLGINSCIRRAKQVIYWPGMSQEIRQYVESCDTCASLPDKQPSEPLILHEQPSRPWQKVATDLFSLQGRNYLLTVDYFSNFFEIDFLPDTTSEYVISKIKHHFARHGIPSLVISDGGPQYTSKQFKTFSEKYGFEHVTSSPGNSQSNGCAEAHVKIAKRIMKKSLLAKEDPYLGLLNWRNTPTEGLDSSPVQRLFGRRTMTTLPTTEQLLAHDEIKQKDVVKRKSSKRARILEAHEGRRTLKPLNVGDKVTVQPIKPNESVWQPATVTKVLPNRTYEVIHKNRTYRRNRRLLRLLPQPPDSVNDEETTEVEPTPIHEETAPTICNAPTISSTPTISNAPVNVFPADSKPYVTRYGRTVKPVIRYPDVTI